MSKIIFIEIIESVVDNIGDRAQNKRDTKGKRNGYR